MGMLKFRSPALPLPTKDYNEGQQDQLQRALKLYFSQLDSAYWDGTKNVSPYAMLMSNQDQLSAGTTSENLIRFDTPVFTNNIAVTGPNDTRIQPYYPGQYLVTMSLQFANRGNAAQIIEVWAKDAGTNYPLSGSRFDIAARKSVSVYSHVVAVKSGIFTVNDPLTEYLEIAWWSDGADVVLEHYAGGTSPTRPEIPSVILTINLVSAIA
jgi:hypothetical protein